MNATATTKLSRVDKLLALVHCPSATPAERDTARLRLREMNAACQCTICLPRPPLPRPSLEAEKRTAHARARSQYRADRPESVAWALKVTRDLPASLRATKRYRYFDEDGARIPMWEVLEAYPSPHEDRSILVEELNRLPRMRASKDMLIIERAF